MKAQLELLKTQLQLARIFNAALSSNKFWKVLQKYYQNEPKFNGAYSRNNLPKIKDGAYVVNPDEHESIVTYWIALYINNNNNVTYFDSFGVEHIPKEIKKFIGNKNMITNLYRIQAYNSVICWYFRTGVINFMLQGQSLVDYTNSFSPN